MKHISLTVILFIVIPFIIITFFLIEPKEKKEPPIIESNVMVRVKRNTTGKIDTVNLEAYVVGVIAGEMPVSFNLEALKAQAVAARSYVLRRIEYNKNKTYDVVDTTLNQVYHDGTYLKEAWSENYSNNIMKIETAVITTQGEYLSYNGKVADALFFSTSNGHTENSEDVFGYNEPYLRSVDSAWDEKTSPVFNDHKEYSLEQFYKLLDLPNQINIKIEILKKTNTGRVLQLKIDDKTYTGSKIANLFKLRSSDFEIVQENNKIIFKTKGYGHGVGMSQYGALGMAKNGYKYDEILKHYYQGIKIEKL